MSAEKEHFRNRVKELTGELKQQQEELLAWQRSMANFMPSNTSQHVPCYDSKQNYPKHFWKLFLSNQLIILKIKEIIRQNKACHRDITLLQNYGRENRAAKQSCQKKKRRTACEIESKISCPYLDCNKKYSCEVSLNLHIKNKHNGGNKTDRERLAKEICIARSKGLRPPEVSIQFPPNYLEAMQKKLEVDELF